MDNLDIVQLEYCPSQGHLDKLRHCPTWIVSKSGLLRHCQSLGNSDNSDIVQIGQLRQCPTLTLFKLGSLGQLGHCPSQGNLDNSDIVQPGQCLSQGNLDNSDIVQLGQCPTWTLFESGSLRHCPHQGNSDIVQLRHCLTWTLPE